MAQFVKGLASKPDDLFLIPRTHMTKNSILLVLGKMHTMNFYHIHNIYVDETVWHRTVDQFYFLKKLHLLLYEGCINLHTHIQHIEYSFYTLFSKHL